MLRGGTWNNNENNIRSSNRNRNNPDNTNNNNGFRCSLPLPFVSSARIPAVHEQPERAVGVSASAPCPRITAGEYTKARCPKIDSLVPGVP